MTASPLVRYEERHPWPDTPHPLGRYGVEDSRDGRFRFGDILPDLVPKRAPVPKYRYYNYYTRGTSRIIDAPPLDQGQCHARGDRTRKDPLGCGHCVGYGGKHQLLLSPMINVVPSMSGSDLYFLAQDNDEWPGNNYNGTSGHGLMKAMQQLGMIGPYFWTTNVDEMALWIATVSPVGLGIRWPWSFFDPQNDWLIDDGSDAGGHWLVVDGVNIPQRKMRLLNTWWEIVDGIWKPWAGNGRVWVSFETIDKLIREPWAECTAYVEQRLA